MLAVILCFLSGIGLSLAFPRTNFHFIAWTAISPLMYYAIRLSWWRAIVCALAFGLAFFASLLYWIMVFGKLPWVALAVFQSLYVVGYALVAKLLSQRLVSSWGRFLVVAALWVVFEWLRSLGPLGFTWGIIGYTQHTVLSVAQLASVTGIWGVSALIAVSNSAVANLFLVRTSSREYRSAYKQIAISAIIILCVVLAGHYMLRSDACPRRHSIPVAVVQGNIPQTFDRGNDYEHRVWKTYTQMTLSASKRKPLLVVWPETVVPGLVGVDPGPQKRLSRLSEMVEASLLVGGWDSDGSGGELNTVFLFTPGNGIVDRYSKVRLVPFGEYLPNWVRQALPFVQNYKVTPRNVTPGSGFSLVDTGWGKIGTVICFESIFPYISRNMTSLGAEVLCVVTNDSWFEDTAAAEQHTAMSAFRAIENRRYLLHCATTGASAIFDPCGRVLARGQLLQPAILHADIMPALRTTLYTRYGDWFVYVCVGLVVLVALASVTKMRHLKS